MRVDLVASTARIAALALAVVPGCGGSDETRWNAGIVWVSGRGLIEAVNVDGGGRRAIAPELGDQHGDPAWSRDGRALAFWARNSDDVQIHVLWPETGARRAISSDWRGAPGRQFAYIVQPSWAPDGERLAVSDCWTLVTCMIRTVSVSGRGWASVTTPHPRRTDYDPAWSPDGRSIAFVRQRVRDFDGEPAGRPSIFLISRDGGHLRRLTRGRSPSWSPDGRDIVYLRGGSIHRMSVEDGTRRLVVRGLRNPSLVRWSPDGQQLLFTTREDGPDELWVTNADGTERVRILRDAYIGGADWQPGS